MPTPKRITKEQAEANKKKQLMLRAAGYNVKVDGSWGRWQEKQYRKVMASRSGRTQTNQANAAVLALPAAGYAAAQFLEGIGASLPSFSLPAISGSTLAASAPIALTLAGPLYGAYELATGQHHSISMTPQERQQMTFAPDATRVERPIVVSRTRVGSQSRPVGEMYLNPALTHSGTISMASEATQDSTATAPRDSVRTSPSSSQQTPNQGSNDRKPKKKNGFKEGAKQVGRNISRTYGRVLRGGAYGTGYIGVPGAIGYGVYKWNQPDPTAADSLLEEQSRQLIELNKLNTARQNQITIDSLRRSLSRPTIPAQSSDTATIVSTPDISGDAKVKQNKGWDL